MKVIQSRLFARKVRRFQAPEKQTLDEEIHKIMADPSIGEEKRRNLRGVSVHKFKLHGVQYLLAYRMVRGDLELIMIGPHQNYYRNLAKYLKS